MNIEILTTKLLNHCNKNNLKKIYICGNGGAGKTTLSKGLYNKAKEIGKTNLISLDDFIVDTELRKNSINTWIEDNKEYKDRYTSCNYESYFLKNVYEILYNIDNGLDCYYFPKRYKEKNNIRKLYSDYNLTIIEGIGTTFLDIDKKDSILILLECSKEDEIKRRIERTEKLNRNKLELYNENRASQYRVNIINNKEKFDIIIESDKDYNFKIIKGNIKE